MTSSKQACDTSGDVPSGRSDSDNEGGSIAATGIALIGVAYILTTMIGPGALSLPWAVAQLGWSLGPPVIILFSISSYYTFSLQALCIRSDDPEKGQSNYTYMDAVRENLGGFEVKLCEAIQNLSFYGTAVVYTVASITSMMAVMRSGCFHSEGHEDSCKFSNTPYMIAFGVFQIILSQIVDFDRIIWLPILAAVMSFTYLAIGFGLEIAKVAGNGFRGNLTSGTEIWTSFQALGILAYSYSNLFNLNEIRDRIKSPASQYKIMEKTALRCVAATSIFKMLCGISGYAAFSDASPTNLLTGFGFYNPYWLLDLANIAVVVHLVIGYQIICQPLFASVEKTAEERFPKSEFVCTEIEAPIPGFRKANLFRVVWRTIFVIMTTCVSTLVSPFLNDVVGILGPLKFWPLTVYIPVEIYIKRNKISGWSLKWIGLQSLSVACFMVCIVSIVGSVGRVIYHSDLFS